MTRSNYRVITHIQKCIYSVITSKWNYNVITNRSFCNYIVITLALFASTSCLALEWTTPVQEGSLVYGRLSPDERLFWTTKNPAAGKKDNPFLKDAEIRKDKTGIFVFGLPQDAEASLVLMVEKQGKQKTITAPVLRRTWQEEVVSGLPPEKVILSPENQARATREAELLRTARQKADFSALPVCFSSPVPQATRISSVFGARRILNGVKTVAHSGVDYAAPVGTPVIATADGIVLLAHDDMFYSGKTILVAHGFGVFSSYSHLSQINVIQNQSVKRGEKLGEVGATGRATGPHLHFSISWFNARVDPEEAIRAADCP